MQVITKTVLYTALSPSIVKLFQSQAAKYCKVLIKLFRRYNEYSKNDGLEVSLYANTDRLNHHVSYENKNTLSRAHNNRPDSFKTK